MRSTLHEAHVVSPDALYGAAGRLQAEASVSVGRHPFLALRSRARPSHVQRLHGRDGVRRGRGLRRHLLQRAPQQRLRPDAVAEPDRLRTIQAHHRHRDLRHGQFPRTLQSADPCRRRVRDDRLHIGRSPDRRLPRRLADGHLLRLRPEPLDAARALSRGSRPRRQGLDREGDVRLQWPLQPAALCQRLAPSDPE